jgi:hypothetical protein
MHWRQRTVPSFVFLDNFFHFLALGLVICKTRVKINR